MWTDKRAEVNPKPRPFELLSLPALLALLFLCPLAATAGPPHSGMVLVLFPNNADESPGLRFSIRVSALLSRPTLPRTSKTTTGTSTSRARRTPINDGSRPSSERSEEMRNGLFSAVSGISSEPSNWCRVIALRASVRQGPIQTMSVTGEIP